MTLTSQKFDMPGKYKNVYQSPGRDPRGAAGGDRRGRTVVTVCFPLPQIYYETIQNVRETEELLLGPREPLQLHMLADVAHSEDRSDRDIENGKLLKSTSGRRGARANFADVRRVRHRERRRGGAGGGGDGR